MDMNNKDFAAIDQAAKEFFKSGKVNIKCPRCGNNMVCIVTGNSYEVKCKKTGCISEKFSGI